MELEIVDNNPKVIQGYKTSKGVYISFEEANKNRVTFRDGDGWREGSGAKIKENVLPVYLLSFINTEGQLEHYELGKII
jgi:hypothetical protein